MELNSKITMDKNVVNSLKTIILLYTPYVFVQTDNCQGATHHV